MKRVRELSVESAKIEKDLEVDDAKTLLSGLKLVGDFLDKSILKPDRVIFHNPGQISIIDYKTGEEINKHKKQLREYASSMEELGLKVKNLFLVYTLSTHKVVKV